MDSLAKKLNRYRDIIEQLLTEIASVPYAYGEVQDKTIFDRKADRYIVVSEGFDKDGRVNNIVSHIEIMNSKVWLQADNTDRVIARQLEEAGIPKSDIVIGFRPAHIRALMEYAVA